MAEVVFNRVDFHVLVSEKPTSALRISYTNNNPAPMPVLVQGDKVSVRVFPYVLTSAGALETCNFATGSVVTIGALAASPIGTDELFDSGTFAIGTPGADGLQFYEATVGMNTVPIDTLLAGETEAEILVNIQVEDLAGVAATKRKTIAYFAATLKADVLSEASDPTLSTVTKWPATFSVISANGTTMVAGGRYALDTTAGALSITLPTSPAIGATIELFDAQGTWGTNNGTLIRGVTSLEDIEDTAASLTLNVSGARLILEYVSGAKGWRVN
jgi:hypothetical protein